jgi:hypothetical protein
MTVLSDTIMKRVRGHGHGSWVFGAKDFLDLGNRAAVDQSLSRLYKASTLRRLGHGLYDWPRMSQVLGRPAPVDIDAAVAAIARRDNIRVMPDGLTAAHRLGLTNAVPAKVVYWTDGSTRSIPVGGRTIHLKHVRPGMIRWADHAAAPVVSAMMWFGPSLSADSHMASRLSQRLPKAVKQDLAAGISTLPAWATSIAREISTPQRMAS